ncbi:MAG: cadherin-like beta sandwich domain-containing protein [Eubacterium aggregans]|uniref:cadherin-like beta sandwich domain-containing protein n=1 Tax=Clostridia TaxID=186801 RepID=UPI002B1FBD47|nr:MULTISPECIES: cadherin-like beta sandwich domain-containing protein [Clostridia]MEA5003012.1 cadherin-like beta sandwich domain-containing protein [Christensenella sp.]MEA5073206.1 cadherin-like beta sandwich domain-containing protein [Eubacterium aggregans]
MKKRILAVLIICLMALSAVGISVFAADHSKATLKVDKSSYSQGETVPVKLIISDTGFSDVGVMLKYNTEKLAPAGAGLKDNISTSYYSSTDKNGIFDDDEDYMYRQNDTNGTLGYSFSIADKSTNSLVLTTTNETPNYRYIDASSEGGYLVATFNLKAKADITLGDGDLGFQKDPTTSNRDILVTLGTAKLDTAASVSIPEAPKPAGTVHVTVENQKATAAEGAAFTGVLVDKDVEITSTSTVLSAVQTALGDYTLEEKGGYISKINGLGAGVGADYAGWMATIEDWFTNNPLNQYTPADGTLKDGQQIKVVYSKTGGTDVGGDWSNNTKTLSALTTDAGTLSPAFDAETKNYTLNIPAGVSSVKITPTAANKNFQVHTYLGTQTEGKEYLRSQSIPVEDGSIITIVDGDPSWPSMNNGYSGGEKVAAETYTVTVKHATSNLKSLIVHTSTSPNKTTTLLQNKGDDFGEAPLFDAETISYDLAAQSDSIYQLRFRAMPEESGATVKLKWGNEEADITWTSGSSKWANCLVPGKNQLQLVVTPPEGSDKGQQTYVLNVDVVPTLSNLSVKADDATVYLDKKFSSATTDYSVTLPQDAKTLSVMATPKDAAYTVTYNGQSAKDVDISSADKVDVQVTAGSGDKALSKTYTLALNRVAAANLRITTTPSDAVVKVYDAQGAEQKALADGTYKGMFGTQTYTYTVTKTGYVAKTGDVPAAGGSLTVNLEKAAANPASVSADWKNFRGNDQNNGITTAKTPKSADGAALLWSQKLGTGWSASPTPQIIVDNTLITGVNKNIYKLDLQTGKVLAKGDMVQSPSFAYSAPVYADGMIFIQLGGGTVQAFNATTLESLWVYTDPLKGQALSPITYADGYLYTGFWNSEAKDANYVCLSASDEDASKTDEAKTATWRHTQAGGFYWAGSVVVGDALIIGTDDGANGYNGDSHLLALNRINGDLISDTVLTGMGDQRSTITYDAGKIYFTTKNGYLCRADVDAQGNITNLTSKNYPEIGGQSTSTPVVYKGRVYFGMGGGVGSAGKFVACDAGTLDSIYTVDLVGYPQCSMLLSTAYEESNGNLYFYSTYNMNPGGIAMIEAKADGSSAKKVDLYDAKGFAQYCTCSIIAGTDGTLYYKNDSGNILAVGFSAVGKLEAEIDALGTITLDSKAAIENAEAGYKALSAEEQAQVTNYQTLLDARSTYDALVALKQAKETAGTTLESYKSADLYRDAEKALLANAIADGKAAINQATDLEGINTALAAAKTTIDAIKTDAQYDIEEAADLKTAQDAAIEELKNYKNKADYRDAEQAQLDQTIQSYSEQIRAITIDNNDLSGAKERVKTTLASGKTALDGIKTDAQYKVEEDQAAAAKIDAQIAALPAADQLTLENETAVTEARTAYEALTADQKVYVKNLETLKAAEAKISDLQAEAEAKPVIDKMSQAIGAINEKSETALDAYNEAITAYNALSPAAKGKADAKKSAMDTALNTKSAEQHTKTADVTTEDGKKLAAAISDKDGKMLPLNIALEEIKTVTTENIEKAKAKLTGKDLVLGIGISINEDQMTDDQKAELAKNGYQVTISCDLTGYKTESIKVAHVLKDGKVEILDAQYDANAKTVTFITKSFSDFMVMAEKLPIENTTGAGNIAADGTNSTKNTATGITEGNLNTAFAGILIFAAVCGMAILVRKQKQD